MPSEEHQPTPATSYAEVVSSRRLFLYLPEVLLATAVVLLGPLGVVWGLGALGWVHSTLLLIAIGMGLSLALSYAGGLIWRARTGSNDLMFGELMLWGWFRRLRIERQLNSMVGLLVGINESPELSPERRKELLTQLAYSLEARDPYTHGHSRRVARSAVMIAKRMDLPEPFVAKVRAAALLHDVGKLKTPKAVLHKPGRLTDEEYAIIKRHPGDGAEMVAALGDAELTGMVRSHHERLDGTGYPDRLPGSSIPLGARIISVADTFDAITSIRPYRTANAHKKALDVLEKEAGTQLDPEVVRAFRSCYFGRRPAMIWASLTNIPVRLVSWVGDGLNAAGAASVVRVMAVSAVTAAAGSTGVSARLQATSDHHGAGSRGPLMALVTGGRHGRFTPGGGSIAFPRAGSHRSRRSHTAAAPGLAPQAVAAAFSPATTAAKPTGPSAFSSPSAPQASAPSPPVISTSTGPVVTAAGPPRSSPGSSPTTGPPQTSTTTTTGSTTTATTTTATTTAATTTAATTTAATTTAATTTESATSTNSTSSGSGPVTVSSSGGGGSETSTTTTTASSTTSSTESTTSVTTQSTTTTDSSTTTTTTTTVTSTTTSPATTTTTSTSTTSTSTTVPPTCLSNCSAGVDNSQCHDHCAGSNDVQCHDHCSGANDSSCHDHCSGSNDTSCHDHCVGNPPSCHTACDAPDDAAAAAADIAAPAYRRPVIYANRADKPRRRAASSQRRRPDRRHRPN